MTAIAKLNNCFTLRGVSEQTIQEAESALHLKFAADYREYLNTYGCIAFADHEFTGLGCSNRLHVGEVTRFERSRNPSLVNGKYVIETLCDGQLLILQDSAGPVLALWRDGTVEAQYDDLGDYIEQLDK